MIAIIDIKLACRFVESADRRILTIHNRRSSRTSIIVEFVLIKGRTSFGGGDGGDGGIGSWRDIACVQGEVFRAERRTFAFVVFIIIDGHETVGIGRDQSDGASHGGVDFTHARMRIDTVVVPGTRAVGIHGLTAIDGISRH